MSPERPKPPAWLSISGSPRADAGAPAARKKARRLAAKAAAKVASPASRPRRAAPDGLALSDNARVVLERRYLTKDGRGKPVETPVQLFRRVARNIAEAEAAFAPPRQAGARVAEAEGSFFDLMSSLRFLPNSPTLGNAGRAMQQLSACFVLPVEDSMEGIFDSLKDTALIHQSGGGTGFAFSRLRPAGDIVASTGGTASGPVSFMKVYDAATESIKQGGTRRGANMAILSVDHPDIEAFINVKADMVTLQNFNISVAVTEAFMEAVERDDEYDLVNPRTRAVTGSRRAREVFRQLVANAWQNGDPGLVFLDRINRDNPTPQLGHIEATNPCGEQPLLPHESCNLGSINLSRFVKPAMTKPVRGRGRNESGAGKQKKYQTNPQPQVLRQQDTNYEGVSSLEIDWDALAEAIPVCVRFLDDVIEQNRYPIPEIDAMTKQTRKIGLGLMGWADLLFLLRIRYDSDEAVALAERVAEFVSIHADRASEALAVERGVFPAWPGSIYDPASGDVRSGHRFRNATRTTIAPTGTLSIIADCSGGIEPVFALAFMRQHYLDPKDPAKAIRLPEVNKTFAAIAKEHGFYSTALIEGLAESEFLSGRDDVPAWAKDVFRTSHDIDPEWHVRMQAAFQRHTDNAVSKTINFRQAATVQDVERAYLLAYREGCKGITVYRDGSRDHQVFSHTTARGPEQAEAAAAQFALGIAEALVDANGAHPSPVTALGPRPVGAPYRRHLPDERQAVTHKFRVGEQEGYVTVGLYDDGSPGEIFVNISKEGSTIRGLMDSVAVLTSVALQYGVPLQNLVEKFRGVHFEPAGLTGNPVVPSASSLVDYIFRWMEVRFLRTDSEVRPDSRPHTSARADSERPRKTTAVPNRRKAATKDLQPRGGSPEPRSALPQGTSTGMGCPQCGTILVFAEGCFLCPNCGFSRC
jgi:ribonucleoside-diphosphate reductase alpha chain